jgi:aspartate aminotransferase
MTLGVVSTRMATLTVALDRMAGIEERFASPAIRTAERIADFTFGNPHERPLEGVVQAFQTWSAPRANDWYAYKMSERSAQEAAAASLRDWYGVPFEAEDIAMTNGGFAALSIGLKAVTNVGDEVIFSLPPWLAYEAMILEAGLTPVKVRVNPETYDLDLDAIAAAITPRTRMVIVNTPHNPTGKIYPAETLKALATLLNEASRRHGREIFILSDEPYNRLVFDGMRPHSPAEYYPNTLLAYSYGKTLLIPGQRIGYLALQPDMPERQAVRANVTTAQIAAGWMFPNALLQYALPDLEELMIDVGQLQRKRDRLVNALRDLGYEVHVPEGTFYLFPKSPIADDERFTQVLAERGVHVLPGTVFETPGYFRISLTATEEMIERSIPAFADAIAQAWALEIVDAVAADGY